MYSEFFKFSSQHTQRVDGVTVFAPVPNIEMFLLHRHLRSDGIRRVGDIVKLTDVREFVELVPRFGKRMDKNINCNNSLELSDSFYLNSFADKETYHSILSYQ